MSKKKTEVKIQDSIIGTGQLAAIVGKSDRWIRQLTSEGILKQVGRGKYILGESVQAYIDHVSGANEDKSKPRFADIKAEHELIKKEKSELELKLLKEQLHDAKDVEILMSDMILTVKSRLQALPVRMATQLENESARFIEKKLSDEINAVLDALSRYSPNHFLEKGE